MTAEPVLIVGAGPSGLVLALSLARRGAPFRIIDENPGPGEHSRAMGVHARTLEFYQQFGFADEVVASGVRTEAAHLREGGEHGGGREVLSFHFKDMGEGISPYPFVLAYPQDDHERLLVEKLRALGVEVEREVKLTGFVQEGKHVRAMLSHKDGRTEEAAASYICGCDGAHSCVRRTLGIGFPGGDYEQLFFVADVKIEGGFQRDFFLNLGAHILTLMLPVRSSGMQRLIGLVPPEFTDRKELTFDDIRQQIEPLVDVKVTEVNWFSTYRSHHRIADRFRVDRAFLLGDAGHIHSPAGGQGMNTGIGDAINLGWKLAEVLAGRASAELLDSYEPERIGFAKALVATTDTAFTRMIAEGAEGAFFRRLVAPLVFGIATRMDWTRHALFRTLSQTRIHYEGGPLSEGEAGHVHGGDRLPWIGPVSEDNFRPLQSLAWQAHVYGDASSDVENACRNLSLPLHRFAWSEGAERAGFERGALYLVRPDGYVALAVHADTAAERLGAYATSHALRFVSAAAD